MKPLVSVIISTRNEEKNIQACLTSIRKQTYGNIEIIVVDNGSSDATKQIAKNFTPLVFDKGPERSAQRNFGASKANGKFLLFLDADMVAGPDVVKECCDALSDGKRKAAVIPEESFGMGFWAKCKALERSFYLGVEWIEAARFFRKDVFSDIGGYDESLTGPEDFDLPQRIKEKFGKDCIVRICAYIRHNEGNLSLGGTLSKKYYYGKKMQAYRNKPESRKYAGKQASLLRRYILFFGNPKKLFMDPVVGIGMLFMKAAEMTSLAAGYVAGVLSA